MPNQNDNRLKPGKTTGFTNIGDIVRANRENRLGGAVQRGVQNVIGQGQQQLGQQKQEFQQQAQQNALGTQEHKQQVQQAIQNAGQNQPDQSTIDRFAEFRAGQYKGPTELGNKEQLIGQGQQIQGIANAASGPQGQRGLLQRFVAPQQQYTSGQQRLDSLLLGQTGGQALRGARQAANQFNQQLIGADVAARAQGQGLQQQAQQFGQQVRSDLTAAQQAQQQDLQSRQVQAQKQAEAARQALYSLLSKPVANPVTPSGEYSTMPVGRQKPTITQEQYDLARPILEQLAPGGIYSPEYFANKPEEIIGQLNANVGPASIDQIASNQDKSRAAALSRLSGQQQNYLTGDIGGYDPLSFLNKDRFNQAIQQSKKAYDEYSALTNARNLTQQQQQLAQNDYNILLGALQSPQQDLNNLQANPGEYTFRGTPGGRMGWNINQNATNQLQQGYNQQVQKMKQANEGLRAQGLAENYIPSFDEYLYKIGAGAGGAFDPTNTAADKFNLSRNLQNLAPQIQTRESLGAGGPNLSLLDKLQSLIGPT